MSSRGNAARLEQCVSNCGEAGDEAPRIGVAASDGPLATFAHCATVAKEGGHTSDTERRGTVGPEQKRGLCFFTA
jgi:hypothetical protein